jgi:hypothetical protein
VTLLYTVEAICFGERIGDSDMGSDPCDPDVHGQLNLGMQKATLFIIQVCNDIEISPGTFHDL